MTAKIDGFDFSEASAPPTLDPSFMMVTPRYGDKRFFNQATGKRLARVIHVKERKYADGQPVRYIGRTCNRFKLKESLFSNPFLEDKEKKKNDGTREEVIEKFRLMLRSTPELVKQARLELRGCLLACWCSPLPCHGDILAAIANAKTDEEVERILNTPQNKAPMKKPQRTKAPLSSSAPSLQHKAKAKKKGKPAFATHAEQTLLAAVLKYGNNYQLAQLAGTTPDILSRFARQERTLRLDTAGQVAAALGIRFQ